MMPSQKKTLPLTKCAKLLKMCFHVDSRQCLALTGTMKMLTNIPVIVMSQVQVAAQPRSMITELKAGERNPEIWAKWSALKVIFHLFDEKKGWVRCESPASAL
jgi:hypothetical protein